MCIRDSNQNQNIHNQYQIVTDGLATSKPNRDIENKWIDSLVGYDAYGKLVPDPTLGERKNTEYKISQDKVGFKIELRL